MGPEHHPDAERTTPDAERDTPEAARDTPDAERDSPDAGRETAEPTTRAGYVALIGRPNAGKSTLLNALIGSRLSIVTARAQTTWQRVTGIRTTSDTQMIFLDTPGLLDVRNLHQRSMLHVAHEAIREADVALLVVDVSRTTGPEVGGAVAEALTRLRAPLVVALNKVDVADAERAVAWERWCRASCGESVRMFPVSALEGTGTEALLAQLEALLPRGPFLYPPDDLASQPVRFFVAELVRETVFEQFEEEVPYAVAVEVEEFRESQDPVYIGVTLLVERKTQQGILVGRGGRAIRKLGTAARVKIETFLDRPVYLDLWVKTLPGWRRKRHHLARLGYRVPEDDG